VKLKLRATCIKKKLGPHKHNGSGNEVEKHRRLPQAQQELGEVHLKEIFFHLATKKNYFTNFFQQHS